MRQTGGFIVFIKPISLKEGARDGSTSPLMVAFRTCIEYVHFRLSVYVLKKCLLLWFTHDIIGSLLLNDLRHEIEKKTVSLQVSRLLFYFQA